MLESGSFRLLDCDPAFEQLVGRSRGELRGVSIFDLLEPEGARERTALRRALELRSGTRQRLNLRRPSGSTLRADLEAREFELDERAAVHTTWRDLDQSGRDVEAGDPRVPRTDQLLDLVDRLIASATLEQLAEAVHAAIGAPLGFDQVSLWRWRRGEAETTRLAGFPPSTATDASHSLQPTIGSEFGVRDQRGEEQGLELRFSSAGLVEDLEPARQLAKVAANYAAGAYKRLRLEYSYVSDESILQALLTKTSAVTGQEFIDTLVRQLALALELDYVIATRYTDSARTHLGTISYWNNGTFKEQQIYAIEGTPSETVLDLGQLIVKAGVKESYPADAELAHVPVDAYLGIAVRTPEGEILGHLCGMASHPIDNSERAIELLRFFAARIAAELNRIDRGAMLQDAVASRGALVELLQISLSKQLVSAKLEQAVQVLSKIRIGTLTGSYAIYLYDEKSFELTLSAQHGLDDLRSGLTPDPVQAWVREHATAATPNPLSLEQLPCGTDWLESGEFCLVPIRTESQLYGLLAAQFERATTDREEELDFLQAAAGVLAGMLERSRSEHALSEAETRVLRSQRLEAVGQLAGGIAHDFNNLLTAILGNADLLNARLPGLVEVASIRRASESAGRLTAQLLAFTRRQVLKTERVDIGLAVTDVVQMLERIIPESITLRVRAPGGSNYAMVDTGQLQQVLINLVVNAHDAMPKGGLLGIAVEELTLDRAADPASEELEGSSGKYVLITVSDTGIGIEKQALERVFEPFYSTKEPPVGARSEGTGLGLAVVYGIVKQHGGHVDVRSELGRGTQFHVYLPADQTEPPPLRHGSPRRPTSSDRDASILVVEDEMEVREIAASLLESLGYRVQTACGGPEALARFSDPEFEVDAVLLDVVMPVMSGIQTFKKLRTLRPDQKVIFMTGHDATAGLKDLLRTDDAALLHKPFTRSQLGEGVEALLQSRPMRS